MVNKIITWLNSIPADKYKHFSLGVIVCALSLWITALLTSEWMVYVIPITITTIVAIGKEIIDDEFSWSDIIATVLGGIFIVVTYII